MSVDGNESEDPERRAAAELLRRWSVSKQPEVEQDARRQAQVLARAGRLALRMWEIEFRRGPNGRFHSSLERDAIRREICRDEYEELCAEGEVVLRRAFLAADRALTASTDTARTLARDLPSAESLERKLDLLAQEIPKLLARQRDQLEPTTGGARGGLEGVVSSMRADLATITRDLGISSSEAPLPERMGRRGWLYLREGLGEVLKAPFTLLGLFLTLVLLNWAVPGILKFASALANEVLDRIKMPGN